MSAPDPGAKRRLRSADAAAAAPPVRKRRQLAHHAAAVVTPSPAYPMPLSAYNRSLTHGYGSKKKKAAANKERLARLGRAKHWPCSKKAWQQRWADMEKLEQEMRAFVDKLDSVGIPFNRELTTLRTPASFLRIEHSALVTDATKKPNFGVRYIAAKNEQWDRARPPRTLAGYDGWLLTRDEAQDFYDEQAAKGRPGLLYCFTVRKLNGFLKGKDRAGAPRWRAGFADKWRTANWVILGKPTSLASNFNTKGAIRGLVYKAEFSTRDPTAKLERGRWSIANDLVCIQTKPGVLLRHGEEIFVPYGVALNTKVHEESRLPEPAGAEDDELEQADSDTYARREAATDEGAEDEEDSDDDAEEEEEEEEEEAEPTQDAASAQSSAAAAPRARQAAQEPPSDEDADDAEEEEADEPPPPRRRASSRGKPAAKLGGVLVCRQFKACRIW